nr:MAG TPA: hypothetical protein [Caudoviricetes sp.]
MPLFLLHIGLHEFFYCGARLLIFLGAIKRGVVPVVFLVDVPPTIVRQFQRLCKDDGSPVVDKHIGCDLTRDTLTVIIMPDVVGIQTIRDSIPIKTDAGEQRRLSTNRDLFELISHCIKECHNLSPPYKKRSRTIHTDCPAIGLVFLRGAGTISGLGSLLNLIKNALSFRSHDRDFSFRILILRKKRPLLCAVPFHIGEPLSQLRILSQNASTSDVPLETLLIESPGNFVAENGSSHSLLRTYKPPFLGVFSEFFPAIRCGHAFASRRFEIEGGLHEDAIFLGGSKINADVVDARAGFEMIEMLDCFQNMAQIDIKVFRLNHIRKDHGIVHPEADIDSMTIILTTQVFRHGKFERVDDVVTLVLVVSAIQMHLLIELDLLLVGLIVITLAMATICIVEVDVG